MLKGALKNKLPKKSCIYIGIICIAIILGLFILVIAEPKTNLKYSKTIGKITNINEEYHYDLSDKKDYFTIYIKYNVNGHDYIEKRSTYSSLFKNVDDEISVYYDEKDPLKTKNTFIYETSKLIVFFLGLYGVCSFFVCLKEEKTSDPK